MHASSLLSLFGTALLASANPAVIPGLPTLPTGALPLPSAAVPVVASAVGGNLPIPSSVVPAIPLPIPSGTTSGIPGLSNPAADLNDIGQAIEIMTFLAGLITQAQSSGAQGISIPNVPGLGLDVNGELVQALTGSVLSILGGLPST